MQAPDASEPSSESVSDSPTDFPSREEIRQRLAHVSRSAAAAFTARCALRVLPLSVRAAGGFPARWSIGHILSLPRACEAALRRTIVGGAAYAAAAAAAAEAYAAATAADEDGASYAAYTAAVAADDDAAAAADDVANIAARKGLEGRENGPPLAVFRASILADLAWLKAHPTLAEAEPHRFLTSPLFASASDVDLSAYLRPWRAALLAQAGSEKDPAILAEATAIANRIEGYFHGRWDWVGQLGSELAAIYRHAFLDAPPPPPTPLLREPLTDQAIGTYLARLALLHPVVLPLAANPTPQALRQALDSHKYTDAAGARELVERLVAPAADFTPDPVWLAWFQTTKADFCQAVRGFEQPVTIRPTPIKTTPTLGVPTLTVAPNPTTPPASSPETAKKAKPTAKRKQFK